jgi:hypothetical protein
VTTATVSFGSTDTSMVDTDSGSVAAVRPCVLVGGILLNSSVEGSAACDSIESGLAHVCHLSWRHQRRCCRRRFVW